MALTGQDAGFTLARLRRGAGLRPAGLRGVGWVLRPLADDGLPRPPDFGRGTGDVVRVATVATVRERNPWITPHTLLVANQALYGPVGQAQAYGPGRLANPVVGGDLAERVVGPLWWQTRERTRVLRPPNRGAATRRKTQRGCGGP
jgi:hypothetical protein